MTSEKKALVLLIGFVLLVSGCVTTANVAIPAGIETNQFAEGANRILQNFRDQITSDYNKQIDLSGFSDEFKDTTDINTTESVGYTWHDDNHGYFTAVSSPTSWTGTGTDSVNLGGG